jgi:hypothetical protein
LDRKPESESKDDEEPKEDDEPKTQIDGHIVKTTEDVVEL